MTFLVEKRHPRLQQASNVAISANYLLGACIITVDKQSHCSHLLSKLFHVYRLTVLLSSRDDVHPIARIV